MNRGRCLPYHAPPKLVTFALGDEVARYRVSAKRGKTRNLIALCLSCMLERPAGYDFAY